MSNTYLDFISDEDLFGCIGELHNTYLKVKKEVTLKDFYKNKVDPIRFNFDMLFNDIDEEKLINNEIMRQKEKTIGGAIGTFHENLLGCIQGVINMPVGYGYDVKKDDESLFAEIKNKFNTVKGEDLKGIHNKLANLAEEYEDAVCYFVHIIAKKSINEIWRFTSKGESYEHPRVRIVSADKFYAVLTGDNLAFKKICNALPVATKAYLERLSIESSNSVCDGESVYEVITKDKIESIYQILEKKSLENSTDIIGQLFIDTFNSYEGF